jgi:hypothetical protein
LKDPQAVPALLEALKDEDETPVRFDPSVLKDISSGVSKSIFAS